MCLYLTVGDGLLGKVIVEDDSVLPVVAEVLSDRGSGVRREELKGHQQREQRKKMFTWYVQRGVRPTLMVNENWPDVNCHNSANETSKRQTLAYVYKFRVGSLSLKRYRNQTDY